MNITEANATSRVLSWLTGRDNTTAEQARQDAEYLADRVNKALHAGIRPEQVHANWPTTPPSQKE